jgi:hypothetical protein
MCSTSLLFHTRHRERKIRQQLHRTLPGGSVKKPQHLIQSSEMRHYPCSVVSCEKDSAEISHVSATVSEITYCKARFLAILGFSMEIKAQYSSNIFKKNPQYIDHNCILLLSSHMIRPQIANLRRTLSINRRRSIHYNYFKCIRTYLCSVKVGKIIVNYCVHSINIQNVCH